jgi:MFS family permease
VFSLSWGTTALGYTRGEFLPLQMIGVVFFGLAIPLSAVLADRYGRRQTLLATSVAIAAFGFALAPLFGSGSIAGVLLFFVLGFALMGFTYGPLGTALAELFPTAVRYTGASLTFNLGGIVGASLAPYIATWLASHWGLGHVGYYLTLAAALTILALVAMGGLRRRER